MTEQQLKTAAAFAIGNIVGKSPDMEFAEMNTTAAVSLKLTMPWLSDECIRSAIEKVIKDIQAIPTQTMN